MLKAIRLLLQAFLFLTPSLVAAQSRPVVLKAATVLDGKPGARIENV